jgi:hypothetical protein
MSVQPIAVYNQGSTPLGFDLATLVAALQAYVDQCLSPAWGVSAKLTLTSGPVAGSWGFVFLDLADAPGALAYHEVDGSPLSRVFVKTILDAGESVTVAAAHELAEMLCDSGCDQTAKMPDGSLIAVEVADAVEETTFTLPAFPTIPLSDFCLPSYFDEHGIAPFDHCSVLTAPFTMAHGGYQNTSRDGQTWSEVFGSLDKEKRFKLEDRRGHRSEYRKSR